MGIAMLYPKEQEKTGLNELTLDWWQSRVSSFYKTNHRRNVAWLLITGAGRLRLAFF